MIKLHFDICDSTNLRAREFLKENAVDRLLVTATEQSAGRGRQGKSFFSPKGTGVYMTYAFRADIPFCSAVGITTFAAAAVCEALETLSGKRLGIKWVNDIYLEDKKICGILAETVALPHTNIVQYIIIGVGINLTTDFFPEDIRDIAGSLGFSDRDKVISAVTSALGEIAAVPEDRSFMDYYRSRSTVLGQDIICITNQKSVAAKVLSIDDDGGLLVELEDGTTEILRSGEISLRLNKAKGSC